MWLSGFTARQLRPNLSGKRIATRWPSLIPLSRKEHSSGPLDVSDADRMQVGFERIEASIQMIEVVFADRMLSKPDLVKRINDQRRDIGNPFSPSPSASQVNGRPPRELARRLGWEAIEVRLAQELEKSPVEENPDHSRRVGDLCPLIATDHPSDNPGKDAK